VNPCCYNEDPYAEVRELPYLPPGPVEHWWQEDLKRYNTLRQTGLYHPCPTMRIGSRLYSPVGYPLYYLCAKAGEYIKFCPKKISGADCVYLWKIVTLNELVLYIKNHEEPVRGGIESHLASLISVLLYGTKEDLAPDVTEEIISKFVAHWPRFKMDIWSKKAAENLLFLLARLEFSPAVCEQIVSLLVAQEQQWRPGDPIPPLAKCAYTSGREEQCNGVVQTAGL